MPYVQIPKDLAKVKTKVAFNLTKRQLICFSIAIATAVPAYFLLKETLGNTFAGLIVLVIATPSFLAAMYEKNGQPFEKIVRQVVTSIFIRPKSRPYRTENIYEYLERGGKPLETKEK
jgi:hypothetical protein